MSWLAMAVHHIARTTAILGGLVLSGLVALTVLSVSGRALVPLGLGPIPGDFELVEAGTGFAVFAFLSWCHLKRGHASVAILTSFLGRRANLLIDVAADLLMLATALLVARQHWLGTVDKARYGETTFILQFPVWWAYALAMAGAAVFVLTAAYCLLRSVLALAGDNIDIRKEEAPAS